MPGISGELVKRRAQVIEGFCSMRKIPLTNSENVGRTGDAIASAERLLDISRVLREDSGEASSQVELDVAVEEPRSSIVGVKAEG